MNLHVNMKSHIEEALLQCGRDRVMFRDGRDGVAVAIRYDMPNPASPSDGIEKFLSRMAPTFDEAGHEAATAFATHLRTRAREAIEWAERIERALARGRRVELPL